MASIKIHLRNKPNKKGLYPVVLKIIKDRKIKVITLGMECDKKEWSFANSQFKRTHTNHIQRNRILLKLNEKAYKIIDEFNLEGIDYSLEQFDANFRGEKVSQTFVKDYWKERVSDLIRAGNTGNAKVYKESMNSFFNFTNNTNLKFKDINSRLLDKYETYMFETGSTNSGVSVRMRTLRALFNHAIKNDVVEEKFYPFKKYKISNLRSNPIKRAMSREDILKFIKLDTTKHLHLVDALRLFTFSYYTRGMNFHDMIRLRWSNIENGKITYIRSKTKVKFTIEILKPVEDILKFYKEVPSGSKYIFPVLQEDMTPVQIQKRKDSRLKKFNSDLKKIAEIVGINSNITSYVSRHSYATNMKHLGVSTDIISESMGHANQNVTQVYLKNFDTSTIDKANEKLLEEPNLKYVA